MSAPLLLDLYCCEGGAAEGYRRAGFAVRGVDHQDQPLYPFPFHRGDALLVLRLLIAGEGIRFGEEVLYLSDFAVIHASPPCQIHSYMTGDRSAHVDLIPETRELLVATGLPYVIENVEGARRELVDPMTLCGSGFGLRVRRHRLFESNVYLTSVPCAHGLFPTAIGVYGEHPETIAHRRPGGSQRQRGVRARSVEEAREVMGMSWASWYGATQAIPPVYSEWIGAQLIGALSELSS